MPVFLLAIAGNRVVVSSAVFTNAIYADELVSIRLHLGPHGSDDVLHIARVFVAINKSMERLSGLYKNYEESALHHKPKSCGQTLQPIRLSLPEQLPKLEFFSKVNRADGAELPVIDESNEHHAIYLARIQTDTSTRVVFVNFAAKYHEDPHCLLADQDPPLAPALYFCACVIGGVYVVVVEYIRKSGGQSIDGSPPPQPVPAVVRLDVPKSLGLLHERFLVFGNLRETNLLYLPEGGGRVSFVDFDGVCLNGMDRYSACLNLATRLGVSRWQVM
ncbi:hypothetical protein BDM02DRAFT_397705 [Thelephora ganbajun]|uniref:Uncharacterized protein n=1 Tax=Thelephora ganbajun TaxID=370292 RepID=A0ACB6Z987_THEGA|nr:hypothetical protein BDM02DRAFT_397705 [Thelephora ganbajun]